MMKKIKIFLLILSGIMFSFNFSYVHSSINVNVSTSGGSNSNDSRIKNGLLNSIKEDVVISSDKKTVGGFFKYLKDQIFNIVGIIVISMIIWIGIRIASSRGNPEEFKKAWLHFVYLILGIFITFASWGIVKIITSLNIF